MSGPLKALASHVEIVPNIHRTGVPLKHFVTMVRQEALPVEEPHAESLEDENEHESVDDDAGIPEESCDGASGAGRREVQKHDVDRQSEAGACCGDV